MFFFFFQENKPLYSFEDSGDYVVEARWSPVHPALFAAADAGGRLDLWNLNRDTEVGGLYSPCFRQLRMKLSKLYYEVV